MYEKISFPHKPKPQLARCSFKKGFSALCPVLVHWGFSSQCTASVSHVLAEQSTGTSHQSAHWDGSSGIILRVNTARIRLYRATRRWTHTHTLSLLVNKALVITGYEIKKLTFDINNAFQYECNYSCTYIILLCNNVNMQYNHTGGLWLRQRDLYFIQIAFPPLNIRSGSTPAIGGRCTYSCQILCASFSNEQVTGSATMRQ